MVGPLQRGLDAVPGVGKSTRSKLEGLDIFTLDQLAGQFMSLDRDCHKMICWLKQHKLGGGYEETCTRALAEKLHRLLDHVHDSDSALCEPHMQFSQLEVRSTAKLSQFLLGPLQSDCAAVPGVGDVTISRLAALGVHTVDQLAGRFMMFDRDPTAMLQWLDDNRLCGGGFAETTTRALSEKLNKLID